MTEKIFLFVLKHMCPFCSMRNRLREPDINEYIGLSLKSGIKFYSEDKVIKHLVINVTFWYLVDHEFFGDLGLMYMP